MSNQAVWESLFLILKQLFPIKTLENKKGKKERKAEEGTRQGTDNTGQESWKLGEGDNVNQEEGRALRVQFCEPNPMNQITGDHPGFSSSNTCHTSAEEIGLMRIGGPASP